MLVFFLHVNFEDKTEGNGGTDDTHHTKRVGTRISHRNVFTLVIELSKGLLGGTQTRRVCHGTVMNTEHLSQGKRVREAKVKDNRNNDA